MLAKLRSSALRGVDATPVDVEVDLSGGLPHIQIVGLAETAVRESAERVRSAIRNSGYEYPTRKLTVNLAPADLPKAGTTFDLPIAIGLLAASEQIPLESVSGCFFLGELSLDGALKPARGVLPASAMARDEAGRGLFVPAANRDEAAIVPRALVYPCTTLSDAVEHLSGRRPIEAHRPSVADLAAPPPTAALDLRDVRGASSARRALEIAAAGGHNLLLFGPPGSGKSMLARRLPGILPKPTFEESLDVTRIHSVAGALGARAFLTERPFRAPHHTISDAALVGGGAWPRPGEISLAHRGVLFLDELPEFRRNVLEVLRQPLEERRITIARARDRLVFPANLLLAAAMNPCPCGWHGDARHPCSCSSAQVSRYRNRISGPLLDRIDLHVEVPPVTADALSAKADGESSEVVRTRVEAARRRQLERQGHANAELTPAGLRRLPVEAAAQTLLSTAMTRLALSARAHDRILKIARTIADLTSSPTIASPHIAEAVQYRSFDRVG